MKKNIIVSSIVAVVAVVGLAGCSAVTDPQVVDGVPSVENTPGTVAAAEPAEPEEPAAGRIVPVGSSTTVGDWTVGVAAVDGDAAAAIRSANQFNDAAGGQYVLITVSGEYKGSGSGDLWIDLDYKFVGNDGVLYEEAYQVTPADNEDWPTEARAGAVVRYQVLFDVPAGAVAGGTLLIGGYTESFDSVEAEFALGL